MVRHEAEHLYEMFIYNLAGQGIGEEMYLEMTGQSKEQLLENFLPQAETRIIHDLILEAIREKEGIEVSDEEIDDKITEYMEEYGEATLILLPRNGCGTL